MSVFLIAGASACFSWLICCWLSLIFSVTGRLMPSFLVLGMMCSMKCCARCPAAGPFVMYVLVPSVLSAFRSVRLSALLTCPRWPMRSSGICGMIA